MLRNRYTESWQSLQTNDVDIYRKAFEQCGSDVGLTADRNVNRITLSVELEKGSAFPMDSIEVSLPDYNPL